MASVVNLFLVAGLTLAKQAHDHQLMIVQRHLTRTDPHRQQCDPQDVAEILRVGHLSVLSRNASGNATGWRHGPRGNGYLFDAYAVDDSPAVQATIAAAALCGADVFFPAGGYWFAKTVTVPYDVSLIGSAGFEGANHYMTRSQASIFGPVSGPALLFDGGGSHTVLNLFVAGQSTGIIISNLGLVKFADVAVNAVTNSDSVNCSSELGANFRAGSVNAALVIVNAFWLTFERCSFDVSGLSSGTQGISDRLLTGGGQRPAVIMQGSLVGGKLGSAGVASVYQVVFRGLVLAGGGIQYQQLADFQQAYGPASQLGAFAGFFTIQDACLEASATPLLDIQIGPDVKVFSGVESVFIESYRTVDGVKTTYMHTPNSLSTIIQLNCSNACTLNGVTIIAGAADGSPYNNYQVGSAVRVLMGRAKGVTVLNSGHTGGLDIVDGTGLPTGSFVSRTEGGLLMVGYNDTSLAHGSNNASTLPTSDGHASERRSSTHALLLGLAGESTGRLALESTGEIKWGAGAGANFDTTLQRTISNTNQWDPPPVSPAAPLVRHTVLVQGARQGDVAHASHTGVDGTQDVQLSAAAGTDKVVVLLRFAGGEAREPVDIVEGTVRVVLTQWS